MITATLTVNGRAVSADVEPRMHLGDFLRDHLRLTGTHLACEHGVCGACTVVVNGVPVRSCITLAATCNGADVRTIEGFDDDPTMDELRRAFSREHGLQCGFCTPGMLITARDVVLRIPDADDKRIRAELAGNLCRCTGYLGIARAVGSVIESNRMMTGIGARLQGSVSAASPEPMGTFSPIETTAELGPTVNPGEATAQNGWTTFEDSVEIDVPPQRVWEALSDFSLVASCLPGARLTAQDGNSAKGSLSVKLGPISATFVGSAAIEPDEPRRTCLVKGAGNDRTSRSRTRGELSYRVTSAAGEETSYLFINVRYNLQGPLAQFSRSGIARELAHRLLLDFAGNLNARLSNGEVQERSGRPSKLDIGGLLWSVVWNWVMKWRRPSKLQ